MTETKQTTLHSHNEYVAAVKVLKDLQDIIFLEKSMKSDFDTLLFYREITTNYEKQHGK